TNLCERQVVLFLSLVGAAIYALLVYSHDALKDNKAETSSAGQPQSDHSVGNHFSSWDTCLPTPRSENSQSASSQRGDHADQDSERQPGDRHELAELGMYSREEAKVQNQRQCRSSGLR